MQPPLALALLLPLMLSHPISNGSPPTLQSLRDRYRPLLIFSPAYTLPAYLAQSAILNTNAAALAERDLLILPILHSPLTAPGPQTPLKYLTLGPLDQSEARHRFQVPPNSFTVILLGKDGGEKLRSHTALSFEQLRDTVDAMPMRQREMRDRR